MMGALKREFFSHQILNKNRLCLAHCALNKSFTVVFNTMRYKSSETAQRLGYFQSSVSYIKV